MVTLVLSCLATRKSFMNPTPPPPSPQLPSGIESCFSIDTLQKGSPSFLECVDGGWTFLTKHYSSTRGRTSASPNLPVDEQVFPIIHEEVQVYSFAKKIWRTEEF